MQRMSRRAQGSAEEVEWLDKAKPLVQVVVVELRAPGPQVPKPPQCSPGAANRTKNHYYAKNVLNFTG